MSTQGSFSHLDPQGSAHMVDVSEKPVTRRVAEASCRVLLSAQTLIRLANLPKGDAFAVARLWPGTLSNAVDPGWIRTRMGGPGATDDLPEGADTQVWLATSGEPEATVTGHYFKRRRPLRAHPQAYDEALQDELLQRCAELSGVRLTSPRQ